MRRLFPLVLVLIGTPARAQRLPLKYYTVADGLPSNVINRIVPDSRGFLWFCTDEGLSRFDGYGFTNFGTRQGLPHAVVNDLLKTREGEYWIATNGGLVRFDARGQPTNHVVRGYEKPANGWPMFTTVLPEDQDRRARSLNRIIESRDGSVWCAGDKGLYRLERTGDKFLLKENKLAMPADNPEQQIVSDIVEDQDGSLWVGAASGLYRRLRDGSSVRYTEKDGLPSSVIHSLFVDRAGRLWVGSRYGGLFSIIRNDMRGAPIVELRVDLANIGQDWVNGSIETSDGHFWIATPWGLVQFFPAEKSPAIHLAVYTQRNGLSDHQLNTIAEDDAGNLWMGSYAGAMKLASNGFVTYDAQDGVSAINAIFGDRENGVCFRGYVLGDEKTTFFDGAKMDLLKGGPTNAWPRLGRFDGKSFNWFVPGYFKQKDTFGWVGEKVTLQARNGEWWIAASDGIYHFPAVANFSQLKQAKPLHVLKDYNSPVGRPFRLFEDSRGRIWVAAVSSDGNSLAFWDGQFHDLTRAANLPSPKDDLANAFGEDAQGDLWIGFSTGIARYRDGTFQFFSEKDGFPPGRVENIFVDHRGNLWFASVRSGLVRIDNRSSDRPSFVTYTTQQGLSSERALVITEDLRGNIYVGTGRGLDRLDPITGRIKHFTSADGLIAGDFLSAFRDRDGALWFGTQKGMSRFAPALDKEAQPPPILITGLQIGDVQHNVSALGDTEISLPELAANQNHLRIDFVALGFAPGESLRYQYKLEGAEKDWNAVTDQRSVNYDRLAAGHYRFLVRAINADGAFSPQAATVSFTILAPVWQRWWFLVLVAVAVSGVVYSLYRYRVRRIFELVNIRSRIAADLHDDIGSNLTRIAILSEVAHSRLHGNGDEQVDSPLMSIAEISRESVASMSDIVWAINPKRDTLTDLVQRMRRFAGEVLTARGIEFQFHAPDSAHEVKLGANLRRDVFLIFKEALNNVVRHSQCKRAEIDLRLEGGVSNAHGAR